VLVLIVRAKKQTLRDVVVVAEAIQQRRACSIRTQPSGACVRCVAQLRAVTRVRTLAHTLPAAPFALRGGMAGPGGGGLNPIEQIKSSVSCVDCVNALFYCFGERLRTLPSASRPVPSTPADVTRVAAALCHLCMLCILSAACTSSLIAARGSFLRAGPAHQFDRYYKDAQLDDCQRQINELKFCIKLKTAGPEETRVSWGQAAVA
jgi:hypothetical protein